MPFNPDEFMDKHPAVPVTGIYIFILLYNILIIFFSLIIQSKESKEWSRKLWLASGKRKKYEVRFLDIKDVGPNAMVMAGTNTIFMTKELADMLHEQSHIMTKDGTIGILASIGVKYSFVTIIANLLKNQNVMKKPIFILSMVFTVICYLGSGILLNRTHGRWAENKSDNFAVQNGYGKDLITALKKIQKWVDKKIKKARLSKFEIQVNKLSEFCDEHPPMKQRLETIMNKTEIYDELEKGNLSGASKIVKNSLKEGLNYKIIRI